MFDKDNNFYFVDELNGGSIYKYVSANPDATSGDEFFAAGQTFVLRIGAGGQNEGNNGPAITGAATWVAITNATGGPIVGISVVNADGTIDGRASADDNDVRATGYNRPEDMWTAALLALPELPSELEYRIVGRDLVLLDPELNLTLDVLDAAFPADWVEDGDLGVEDSETCAPADTPIIEGNPCDVHSELPMCWS